MSVQDLRRSKPNFRLLPPHKKSAKTHRQRLRHRANIQLPSVFSIHRLCPPDGSFAMTELTKRRDETAHCRTVWVSRTNDQGRAGKERKVGYRGRYVYFGSHRSRAAPLSCCTSLVYPGTSKTRVRGAPDPSNLHAPFISLSFSWLCRRNENKDQENAPKHCILSIERK